MGGYTEALSWANDRGDSGGAQRMRMLILSLYNTEFYSYSAGDALVRLDAKGRGMAFACLREYASVGETNELVWVAGQIKESGMLTEWIERCMAAAQARDDLRSKWRLESSNDPVDRN